MGGEAALGVLAAFPLYLRRFFEPMQERGQFYNALSRRRPPWRTGRCARREAVRARADAPVAMPRKPRAAIEFRDVSFSYRDGRSSSPAWTCPSLGQIIALVGATGAGKSTLAKLVARFYDPVQERVLVDGVGPALGHRHRPAPDGRHGHQENQSFSARGRQHPLRPPDAPFADVVEAARAIGATISSRTLPEAYDTDSTAAEGGSRRPATARCVRAGLPGTNRRC